MVFVVFYRYIMPGTGVCRRENTTQMPDTTIHVVDKSLAVLLQTEKDFPGYALDICSGYVSTDGVVLLKRMLRAAPRVRAIVGLNVTNRVSAFQMLRDDCNVEVYLYVTSFYTLPQHLYMIFVNSYPFVLSCEFRACTVNFSNVQSSKN